MKGTTNASAGILNVLRHLDASKNMIFIDREDLDDAL